MRSLISFDLTPLNILCIWLFYSASDLSEEIVFDSWRAKQSDPANYGAFVQQCIVKAFDWLQTKSIELSKIGNICNILAYTNGARAKEEFCVRLIYCLGFALESTHQNEIATKVRIQTHTHIIPTHSIFILHACECVESKAVIIECLESLFDI